MDTTVEYKDMATAELVEFAEDCLQFWMENLLLHNCPPKTVEAIKTLQQSIETAKVALHRGQEFTTSIVQTLDWFALNKSALVYAGQ